MIILNKNTKTIYNLIRNNNQIHYMWVINVNSKKNLIILKVWFRFRLTAITAKQLLLPFTVLDCNIERRANVSRIAILILTSCWVGICVTYMPFLPTETRENIELFVTFPFPCPRPSRYCSEQTQVIRIHK